MFFFFYNSLKKKLILAHNSYIINNHLHLLNMAPLKSVHLDSGWEPIY